MENLFGAGASAGIALGIVGWIGYQLREIPRIIWSLLRQRVSVTIEARHDEYDTYYGTIEWIQKLFPSLKEHCMQRTYRTQSKRSFRPEIASGVYYFMIDKITPCIISVYTQKGGEQSSVSEKWITFIIYGPRRIKWLLNYQAFMKDFIEGEFKDTIPVIIDYYNGTNVLRSPKRSFSTVFYNRINELKRIIDRFKANKSMYVDHGIVYKTGFLFYGPPGSGKTTLIRAIATYVGWKVVYINGSINSRYLNPKTIFVIEDIDCISESREKQISDDTERSIAAETDEKMVHVVDKMRSHIPLHVLLNLIDGIISPNEVIFIATTNYIERVDPALRRQGRFDHAFEVNYMTEEDAIAMCESFNCSKDLLKDCSFPLPGAILQNKILYHSLVDGIEDEV